MNKKITLIRLEKETASLLKDPIPQVLIARSETYTFHFCLHSLEEDYAEGFYFGVLKLADDYPFSPPKIWFLTQSGRFEVDKTICTSFTHYHKETWSASWNIRTMLTALISFMYTNDKGVGGLYYSSTRRRTLAKKSLKSNLRNSLFVQLFKEQLLKNNLVTQVSLDELLTQIKKEDQENQYEKKIDENQRTVISEKQDLFTTEIPFIVDFQDDNFRKLVEKDSLQGADYHLKEMRDEPAEEDLWTNKEDGRRQKPISFQ